EMDADAAAALFAEGATYRSNIFEAPYEGPEGVRQYWTDVTASQDDVHVRIGEPFGDEARVAAEFWTTMRVEGAATTLAGILLLELGQDGRCSALRQAWHFAPEL